MRSIVTAFVATTLLFAVQAPAQVGSIYPLSETRYNIPKVPAGPARPSKDTLPTTGGNPGAPLRTPAPTATPVPTATPAPSVSVAELMTMFEKIASDSKAFRRKDGTTQLSSKYQEQLGALFAELAGSKLSGRADLANSLANDAAVALRKSFGEAASLKGLTDTDEGKQKLFETGLGLLQGALQKDSDVLSNTLEKLREKNENLATIVSQVQQIVVADPADKSALETKLTAADETLDTLRVPRADRERLISTLRSVNDVPTAKPASLSGTAPVAATPAPRAVMRLPAMPRNSY